MRSASEKEFPVSDLVIDHLCKSYSAGVRAVVDLSLNVRAGEIVVIAGPSGCGKTTVLRLIAGLERPTSGTIAIAGQDVTSLAPGRRSVAMVLQDHPLYPHLNVGDNIVFGLKGEELARAQQQALEVARRLGIDRLLDRAATDLSGGESQRVALARGMVRSRRVTLFDEPLSSVDQPQRLAIRPHLRRFAREVGGAVVYVTHDQSEALALADRLLVMRAGGVEQCGVPEQVLQQPATRFVAEFLSADPICFARGRIVSSESGPQFESNGWSMPVSASIAEQLDSQSIDLGIRASALLPGCTSASSSVPIRVRVVDVAVQADGALATLDVAAMPDGHSMRLFGRFPLDCRPAPGSALDVGLNRAALLWFDAESGRNIEFEPGA